MAEIELRIFKTMNPNSIIISNSFQFAKHTPYKIIKDKKGIRKLTPLECARIQGFPDSYKLPNLADSALYKQFGNSVSVPVIEAVAKQMMKAMG